MTYQAKKEALQNALVSFKFPSKYFVQNADGRMGHKFAIASNTQNGGIDIHSNYLTYDEFNAYLKGWYDAKMKKF